MGRWATFAPVLFVVSIAPGTRAASPGRSLGDAIHVRAGATCLDQATLREQVRAWLESDETEGDLRVEVQGDSADGRVVSFRMWRGARLLAQRTFSPGPADCAQLHAVVGLAIALGLKVSLRDELVGEPPAEPGRGWSLGAAASGAWNVLPGAAGGATLWLEKSLPEHFSAHLELSGFLGGAHAFEHVSGEFTTSSVGLQIALCAVPEFGRGVRGRLCTGVEARALFASGNRFAVSKDAVVDWFAVSNSLGVSIAVARRWSFVSSVGVVLPLERVQIAVVDARGRLVDTRDSAPIGGLLSVGGAYEF